MFALKPIDGANEVMKFMKNVFQLYRADWKRIIKSPLSILLIIALMILPSFYAWFNIQALWDPYSNTSEMPVAVYSADKTVKMSAGDKSLSLNIGDQVIDNLKHNHKIGWKFVDSKDQLVDGVRSGKYYAGIYLPKSFSSNLLSFLKGDIHKPQIDYYVNQKINAIAPKITDKGAGTIQETITKQFTGTVSKALFTAANKLGIDLDSHLVDISKVKNLLLDTDDHLDEIEGYLNEVVALNDKMPEIKGKVSKAEDAAQTAIPQVDSLASKVIALNGKMPVLYQKMSPILTLQQKIPQIENAGRQIKMVNDDFDQIESTMSGAINDAKQGMSVIQKAQEVLPQVDATLNGADGTIASAKTITSRLKDALPQVAKSAKLALDTLQTTADSVVSLNDALSDIISQNEITDKDRQNMEDMAKQLSQTLTSANEQISGFQGLFGELHLNDVVQLCESMKNVNNNLMQHADRLASTVKSASTKELKDLIKNMNQLAGETSKLAGEIDVNQVAKDINQTADQMEGTLNHASDVISGVKQIDAASLLSNTKTTLDQVMALLEKYNEQLPALRQEVSSANELLNGNMATIIAAINKGAMFYQNDMPLIQDKVNQAASFMQNDLPLIESKLNQTIDMVNSKMPMVETALSTTSNLIETEWPGLKAGIQKAADKVRAGENKVDLADIVKLLKNDVKEETNFMEEPVVLKQIDEYPIPNYGSASAPFYTALCLWVGGLLMASLLSVDTYVDRKKRKKGQDGEATRVANHTEDNMEFTPREKYVTKLFEFFTIGLVQAVIVVLGDIFILHTYTKDKVLLMVFALVIAFAFVSLIFTLVGLFNDFGKGIAVIVLVLSISGGGGNFPIQMSGPFFQAINPYLPFTYAVNLLREAVGGVYWPNAIFDLTILLLIGIVSLAVGIWACPYMRKVMKRINEKIEESHFFAA